MITVDTNVKALRDRVTALRKERGTASDALKKNQTELATLPTKAELDAEEKKAQGQVQSKFVELNDARKKVTTTGTALDTSKVMLEELTTRLIFLRTLLTLFDGKYNLVPDALRARAKSDVDDFVQRIKERLAQTEQEIAKQQTTVGNNEVAAAEAIQKEADAKSQHSTAESGLALVVSNKVRRQSLETDIAKLEKDAADADATIVDTEKELGDTRSQRDILLERVPSNRPDYLRFTSSSTPIEAAAKQVLSQLEASDPAFQPQKHTEAVVSKVQAYGLEGSLLAVLDQVQRPKDKPVRRKILAATYAFTLKHLLLKTIEELKGDPDDIRDAINDRIGFANRILHFQRHGQAKYTDRKGNDVPPIKAPLDVFAEGLLEEVAKRKQLVLPDKVTAPAARSELVAKVLTRL